MVATLQRMKFGAVILVFQLVFFIIFAVLVDYDESTRPVMPKNQTVAANGHDHQTPMLNDVQTYYPMFQDVHVMIFIGFGFLMTFLKRYGFSSLGLNFLIAAFVIQWSIIMGGILHLHNGRIEIGVTNMLTADFAAAAVLITFGAVLGKTSPMQMIVVAFVEIILFSVNEWLGVSILMAADIGGSMFVHTFGAYFGLALARVLYTKDCKENANEGSIYHSDLFAMLGTVFLWMFWPSFNSALAAGDNQHRAVLNTYLSLAACCVVTFAVSAMISKNGKFDMVHIQNATLAGGVAVGTSADMVINPAGALAVGTIAAALSTVGYVYITPFLASKLKIHDTCGVNNLHGMPGVLAGIIGAVVAGLAGPATYGDSLYTVFPARTHVTMVNGTEVLPASMSISPVGRSGMVQAGFQMGALLITLVVAIVGGILTGFLIKLPIFDQPKGTQPIMDDNMWFETPDDIPGSETQQNGIQNKQEQLLRLKEDDNEMA